MPGARMLPRAGTLEGWLPWIALFLTWLVSLPAHPLLDPDEGRYAEIPREMLASGDWITPRLDGLKYLEKPPLQYWVTATVYRVLGVSETTSRLWTVGLAFLCLPMVYGWAARLYGRRAGLAALVALAMSPLFAIVGHLGLLDAGFTALLTGTVLAFTLGQCAPEGSPEERRWMLIAWLAAALAVLTKGIVVGVLAGGSLLLYTGLERDMRPWRRLHALPGIALFLAVAAPWFLLVSLRNPGFLQFFFVHEHFARFLTTVHGHAEPWWYFLPFMLVGVLPWIAPLTAGLRHLWREPGPTPQFKPLKFLLIFAATVLVFFSVSGSKLPPYILPMVPPLAVIAGVHASDQRFFRRVSWIAALIVGVCSVGVLVYAVQKNSYIPHETLIWAGVALAATAVAVVVTRRGEEGRETVTQVLALVAAGTLAWQALMCEYGATPPQRSARDLAAAVRPYVHPGTLLFNVGQYRQTLSPYLQRTLIVVSYEGELEFGMAAEPGKQRATPEEFQGAWRASTDAIAFFRPSVWDRYRRQGLPGRVVAADPYTVAVSRS
jgi:4-amino-4-deoxy-L-arabinose transferase-like glycosyltransferase